MLNSPFDKWYYSMPDKDRRCSPDLCWLQSAFNAGIHYSETNGYCDFNMEDKIKYCECGLPEPKCLIALQVISNGLNTKDECKYWRKYNG